MAQGDENNNYVLIKYCYDYFDNNIEILYLLFIKEFYKERLRTIHL